MPSSHNNRRKPRVYCLKRRALVYDTTFESCTIKMDEKIKENYEDYWPFELDPPGTHPDNWDLFLNEKTDRAIAVGSNPPPVDGIFIAGLQLSRLGVWGRLLRRAGALNNGYIIRPPPYRE